MFQEALQPFIEWKRLKGFYVIEAYTNNPEVGASTTSIKSYLQNLYENPAEGVNPPTFGLLVGDVAQIPSFSGLAGTHKTDLYFFEYTGDKLPEVFYGRFSAQSVDHLIPQIEKTLLYEKYEMEDPSYLSDHILVAGVDATWAPVYANGQIRYAHNNFSNSDNSINPYTYLYNDIEGSTTGIASNNSAASADIRAKIGVGVGWANYTAHCSSSGWSNPSFSTSHIPELTNDGKYGVWIGNCCESNRFEVGECFGEAALRAVNKGAVGYVGGSNLTYWHEDYYFAVGNGTIVAFPEYQNFGTGVYDALFHTKANEAENPSKWYITQGQLLVSGNLAVQSSTSTRKNYYWEIYHLMGDPSLTPYLWEPEPMEVDFPVPQLMIDFSEFEINTAPFAYISLSQNGVSIAITTADIEGNATLTIPGETLTIGEADIVITAQNRQPYFGSIIVSSEGPYANFYAEPNVTVLGEPVVFTDASNNGEFSSWLWNFGEGAVPAIATGQGPHEVTYTTPGKKTISLLVDDEYERIRTNYIDVKDIYSLTLSAIGNGTLKVNGVTYTTPIEITEGSKVILEAVADDYWSFSEWTGDLSSVKKLVEIEMNSDKTIVAHFIEAGNATFIEGNIPTDSGFTSLPGQSSCPATLVVSIPLGVTITGVDVEYTMTAANQGWKSEQRSQLRCISEGGNSEENIISGVGSSTGTMVYSRKGLTIANEVVGGGDIVFELHAGRTWSTSGYGGCNTYNNKVDDGSWRILVHYEPNSNKLPTISTWPTATSITYGSKLSESELVGGYAEYNGNVVEGSFSYYNPQLVPNAGIGTYPVIFTPTDTESYVPVQGEVELKVDQLTLTIEGLFTAKNKPYDGTIIATVDLNNLELIGVIPSDDVLLMAEAQFSDKSAGEDKVVGLSTTSYLTGNHSANYKIFLENAPSTTATISPKLIWVQNIHPNSKVYDGTTVATINDAELAGEILGDNVVLTNHQTGVFAQKDVGENIPIFTSMTITGTDVTNYILEQPIGLSANIFQTELLVYHAVAQDKVYDGSTSATIVGAEIEGLMPNDEVILENHSLGEFEQLSVGNNIEVLTEMNLTGTDAENYSLIQPTLSASITPKGVKIGGDFTVHDKIYDGNVSSTLASSNLSLLGLVNNDPIELTSIIAEFEDAEIGLSKMVFIVSAVILGDNDANYSLSLENAPASTASIFAAPQQFTLTVSVNGQGSVVVDGEPYSSTLTYNEGTETTLEATPGTGWLFEEWQGDLNGFNNPAILEINSNKSIVAVFVPITSTGTNNFVELKVFPNPFASSVTFSKAEEFNRLVISNLIGEKLIDISFNGSIGSHTLNTENLPKGIYLFSFFSMDGGKVVRKMVKN